MENNIQELIDIYQHTIIMIGKHEQKYEGKKKGKAYSQQRVLLENRALHYKHKIENLGTETNVIKVQYKKSLYTVDGDIKVPGNDTFNMYFSGVSGDTAKLLLKQAEPLAINIETFPLYLRTEFQVK